MNRSLDGNPATGLILGWAGYWLANFILSRWWPLYGLVGLTVGFVVFFLLAWRPIFQNRIAILGILGLVFFEIITFAVIFWDIYRLPGAQSYQYVATPAWWSWPIFTLEHLCRAVDVMDALEGYNLGFHNVKAIGTISRFYVVCFHALVDIYFFYALFKILKNLKPADSERWGKWLMLLPPILLVVAFWEVRQLFLQILLANVAILWACWYGLKTMTHRYPLNTSGRLSVLLTVFLLAWWLWLIAMGWWLQPRTPLLFQYRVTVGELGLLGLENCLFTLDFLDICRVYEWRLQYFMQNNLIADTFAVFFRIVLVVMVIPPLQTFLVLLGTAKIKSSEELADMVRLGGTLRDKALGELRVRKLLGVLRESKLQGANLNKADLCHTDLHGVHWQSMNLREANLNDVDLEKADLRHADLQNANMTKANLRGTDLTGANLEGTRLDQAYYDNKTRWPKNFAPGNCKTIGPIAPKAILKAVQLANTRLGKADCSYADLSDADLGNADLEKAHFYKASLANAILTNARLIAADLSFADLSFANLSGGQLHLANLSYANLCHAHLEQADLANANLYKANLSAAILDAANLAGARFNFACLTSASLSKTDLSGTYLSYADLSGADLRGAIFTNAKLNETKLKGAHYNGKTVWPAGFDCQSDPQLIFDPTEH